MATYQSTTKSAQDTAASKAGSYIADADKISGKVRFAQADATIRTGGLAASDVVELIDLPAGATIIPGLCSVFVKGAAGVGTWNIGTSADADALATAQDVSATGLFLLKDPTVEFLTLTERTTIQLVTGGVNTGDAAVFVNLAYTVGE
jgi:hypothetical protein